MRKTSNLILHHILWRGLYFFSILVLNILIARFFAAEKSGQLFYIVNNLAFLLLITSLSLESGTAYYVSSGKANVYRMAKVSLLWTVIASAIALTIWKLFTDNSDIDASYFFTVSFLYIFGVLLTTYFSALFYSLKQFAIPNKILFGVNIFMIAALILGKDYQTFRLNFLAIYFSSFFLQGICIMMFFFARNRKANQEKSKKNASLRDILKYSLTALIANVIYFLVNRVDYWFVKKYCSAEDLGNYIQVSKLTQMMLIIPAILGSTLFTIFSSSDKINKQTQLFPVTRMLFSINLFISILIVFLGNHLFPLIFGFSFGKMYLLFVLLIPGVLALTINNPVSSWFSASNLLHINIYGSLLALTIILAGDIFILPKYGILSAPVICSLGYSSYCIFSIYKLQKENRGSLKDYIFIRKADISALISAVKSIKS